MILNDIELGFNMGVTEAISIAVTGGYLLPLKIEIETHPFTEIKTTDLTMGARTSFQIQYVFD